MSWKEALFPVIRRLPTVESPKGHVPLRKKLLWTFGVLILYFFLTNVLLFGAESGSDLFGEFRGVLAGEHGSLMQVGIMPIVTASITLQLLEGSSILPIDKSNPRDQALYQGLQKILVFVIVALQAYPVVFISDFLILDQGIAETLGIGTLTLGMIIYIQVVIGGIMILYMDEIISKWGIGSGIGLFIVAGVSQSLIGGFISIPGWFGETWGVLTGWVAMILTSLGITSFDGMAITGLEMILFGQGQLIALITTIAIVVIVVYSESVRVEIPISNMRAAGARGRYPIKLIYASVLPLILLYAVQANIALMGRALDSQLGDSMPSWLGQYSQGEPVGGLFYFLTPIHSPEDWMWWTTGVAQDPELVILRLLVYALFTIIGSALFAVFWVQTANMGPEVVAKQIQRSGLQIPGHRQNAKSIERVVERYIPHVTILGGALVGFLAVIANMLGTIGGVGGIGLLLAVSITYKFYEQLAEESMMEMHPMLRKMMGNE